MSNVGLLLSYKLKSFFAPSYRGRFGPLPLIALSLVLLPSGFSTGYYMGEVMVGADPGFVVNLLSSALSAMMAFGFIYALGVGITAQPSELDFIMTTPVKPREYLVSDLLFQFGGLTVAGGMAILFSVFGLLWGMGASFLLAVPVLLLMGAYGMMMYLVVQTLTVLRIRYPQSGVRAAILVLLALSVIPMLSLAMADFPLQFETLPIPQAAFGALVSCVLLGSSLEASDVVVAAVYLAAVISVWAKVSGMYFFHGVRPTLSAGFGQVDMSSKMAQQKRMIGGFGRFTTKISLRTDSGGELSLMTRLNLIRFWRDGSFLFVALILGIFLGSGVLQSASDESNPIAVNIFQAGAWPIAILALNWCYYERANLWIPVVGGRSLETYFSGLMISLLLVGLGVAAVIAVVLLFAGVEIRGGDIAIIASTPIANAAVATMLLTRVRVKPGAFSPGLLAVLFGTFLLGAAISGSMWFLVSGIGDSTPVHVVSQLAVTAGLCSAISVAGLVAVARLARGFRLG